VTLFSGVHEVRMLRPAGIAVGYFDDWDAALRAVENEPSQYKAAYFTLNPIKLPNGIPVNPSSLNPTRGAASADDIERRVWLLIDLDPTRPFGTNATEAEKQTAREQAERVREWLCSHGWPEPMLCDSGNGWHLLYRIEIPNDAGTSDLIRRLLTRLKQLFPLVDAGNYDASRICKLYGSWARKGTHSEERPWRRSAIVDEGSNAVVTAEQIRALVPAASVSVRVNDDVKLLQLVGFLDYYGIASRAQPREVSGGWQIAVECPWRHEHSSEANRDTVVSFIAGRGNGFKCLHSHCTERHWRELREEMESRNPALSPYFGKMPPMTHSDIARRFVETHDDFVRLYDMSNETGVWIPGKRWALGDPNDALLRKAIRQYVDELHDRYSPPEPGKNDPRRVLKQAAFVSGVLAEVKPWLPPKSCRDFDTDPAILPLPDGKVADLRCGVIRDMVREDCQTKRIAVMPADVPTPRWDRFLQEITCGDAELADFIGRLFALATTGLSLHHLIFFSGRGRNGKGVSMRLLDHILGQGGFCIVIKPEDVEYQKGSTDRTKRLMGRLRGMRMCYSGETVSGNLDWTLCKTLTGGDALSGAKLYQDESGFNPTHTLFLPTNDRLKLPPTAAFKGRLVFVPFNADFTNSGDMTLEDDLKREAPGILWKLIQLTPSVFERGIEPPASVLEASEDVIAENDTAKPFIEAWLVEDAQAVTPVPEIEDAVKNWLGGSYRLGLGPLVTGDMRFDRIMEGVRARWSYGRKRIGGNKHPVRGLLGVRVRLDNAGS
jgi:P4 family phage/plasmid primase-like protien